MLLIQFGDQLDDAALRELATGPLIQRLRLTAQTPGGLEECTREMFALAMLVRLGKVTEEDIKHTFAAFRRLDVNNDGVLTSKSIIAAMIQKRRSELALNRPGQEQQDKQSQQIQMQLQEAEQAQLQPPSRPIPFQAPQRMPSPAQHQSQFPNYMLQQQDAAASQYYHWFGRGDTTPRGKTDPGESPSSNFSNHHKRPDIPPNERSSLLSGTVNYSTKELSSPDFSEKGRLL